MFLKRAILINWGNIPHIELELGPVNLFSGGNGSGKTTAADAIQALMTAAHENLFAFNPGQDETTQRGKGGKQVRTLASYLLGCDDGSYARTDTHDGYVAGVFCPTEGENSEPFTAIMAMRAHLEKSGQIKQARLDELFFVIVPLEQLNLSHFIKTQNNTKTLVHLDQLVPYLKKQLGTPIIENYDKKNAYLRRLYALLKGRKDSVSDREARHAARTFSNFMAYKPVRSIHDFVAGEILEPRDLGDAIRSVSDLMKTIHDMEANARQINQSVDHLENARRLSSDYEQHWVDRQLTLYQYKYSQVIQLQKQYLKAKHEQHIQQQTLNDTQESIRHLDDKQHFIHQHIVNLEARRQGISVLRQKDELQHDIKRCQLRLTQGAPTLLTQLQHLHSNIHQAKALLTVLTQTDLGTEISHLNQKSFLTLSRQVADLTEALQLSAQDLLNGDWVNTQRQEERLDKIHHWQQLQNRWHATFIESGELNTLPLKEAVFALLARKYDHLQKLGQDLRKKLREIQLLEHHQVEYPAYVDQALKMLREQCPGADAKVLCDHIEIKDTRWQNAIEGYLGGARFGIIVNAAYEAQAIQLIRAMRGDKHNKARIIQGTKASRDADRLSLPPHSIIELMGFNHHVAQDYLKASYGQVLQVANAEELKNTARGLTQDGMASGNYAMFRCDLMDSDLVFGQSARERALAAKFSQLTQLTLAEQQAQTDHAALAQLQPILQQVGAVDLFTPLQDMIATQAQLEHAQQVLNDLNLKDVEYLEQDLQQRRQEYNEIIQHSKQLEQNLGAIQQKLTHQLHAINQVSTLQEKAEVEKQEAQNAVWAITDILPRFEAQAQLETLESSEMDDNTELLERSQKITDTLTRLERDVFKIVQSHNQAAATHDQLFYDTPLVGTHTLDFFKHFVHFSATLNALHNRLKNNVLAERHRQLKLLKESFNTAFVTNLCHSIYQSINEGKNTLDDLNKELQHHCFGNDQERFSFGMDWVPEFQEYWQFFKTIVSHSSLGDGANLFDLELPAKQAVTRDRLMAMLLDEDPTHAHRELGRISDYRNYRRYEIYKQPKDKQPIALSQYGTGSGGQLETPAYIIRAAAVTSAFRFNEGKSHLRMVMVDEAFSKMDETRSREVMRYLTESLGLQLIFIMPTSKSGPFLDMISNQLVFSKCPSQSLIGELKTRVLVDRKVCKQEQIARLWGNHRKIIRHQATLDFMDDF